MSGGGNGSESHDGSGDAADNKPAAGHGIATGLLQKRPGTVTGDVDLKVRAGIDVDGLVRETRRACGRFVQVGSECQQTLVELALAGARCLVGHEAGHDEVGKRLVVTLVGDERLGLVLRFEQVVRADFMRLVPGRPKGGVTAVELVENARDGVYVDGGRATQLGNVGDIASEHFGRGVCRCGIAPNVGALRERVAAQGWDRGTHIDQTRLKRQSLHLLFDAKLVGAEHDVRGRQVAVYKRRLEVLGRQQRAQDSAAYRCGGSTSHALAIVRQHAGCFVERRTLDPLHKDERLALTRAIAVDVGKTTQV